MALVATKLASACCLAVLILSGSAPAQSSFDELFESRRKTFDDLIEQRQSELGSLLEQAWKEFDIRAPERGFGAPKPLKRPVYTPAPQPDPTPTPAPTPEPDSATPKQTPKPAPVPEFTPGPSSFALLFFGQRLNFTQGRGKHSAQLSHPPRSLDTTRGQEALGSYWSAETPFENQWTGELKSHRARLGLDDWMTFQLVAQLSMALVPNDRQHAQLLAWKFMNRLEYDVRLASLSEYEGVALLLPFVEQLFGTSYLTMDGQKYYLFAIDGSDIPKSGGIKTYAGLSSERRTFQNIAPGTVRWPANPSHMVERSLQANYEGRELAVALTYDQRNANALSSYPQFDFPFYFKNQTGMLHGQTLDDQLLALAPEASQAERAEMFLRLVQVGLDYQTDDEQFGFENYLFPEESLFYPYADCEDRSIIYAGLVHEYLGIDYVVVHYPGHLAVAVNLPGSGDSIAWRGRQYLISDPTYIGAPIGKAMLEGGEVVYASAN